MSAFSTVAAAADAIAAGALSPVELVDACLARVAALEPKLDAFVTETADAARAAARVAEAEIRAGRRRGPLHGIPIGLKDIIDTAGLRTSCHSALLKDRVPAKDATVAARLFAAGAISLGKLSTHEFAFGGPSPELPWPPARNPWNRDHFTGGSSSGSAAAIASGMVLGALGSDTSGSIRQPCALCGVAGLKPTYGRVSRAGVYPLSWTLDHVGPMAWTAEDCAILLGAIAGPDPADPTAVAVPAPDYRAALKLRLDGVRLGVLADWYEPESDPATRAAMDAALGVLRDLGAETVPVRLRPLIDWHACVMVIILAEAWAVHASDLRRSPDLYAERTRDRVSLGAFLSAGDYIDAQRLRRVLAAEMDAAFARVDALVMPAAPGPAPRIDAVPKWLAFEKVALSSPANVAGVPAQTTRMGFTPEGLPLGFQVMGPAFGEARVLAIAHAYELATPWRGRRPAP